MIQTESNAATLLDVVKSINSAFDMETLFDQFLDRVRQYLDVRSATIRLISDQDKTVLVASHGLGSDIVEQEQAVFSKEYVWANLLGMPDIEGKQTPAEKLRPTLFKDPKTGKIVVPVTYRGYTTGCIDLNFQNQKMPDENSQELLLEMGAHLGLAIERLRAAEEATQQAVIDERNRLAHELHDSLAQSLASLRFQVRVLDETLHQGDESALWGELERIENSLDEANIEMRELIANFRAPLDEQDLAAAVGKQIDIFRKKTKIHIFLQREWKRSDLPKDAEMQVLRIIQEALANIRKHSGAHHVRVMMRSEASGRYLILVEDDGNGIVPQEDSSPGEHVGLSIMKERAKRIGGKLRIESEPGEGTRLVLSFRHPNTENNDQRIVS